MKLIPVVYHGFTAMDRRFSSPMLPWIVSEIRKRAYSEKVGFSIVVWSSLIGFVGVCFLISASSVVSFRNVWVFNYIHLIPILYAIPKFW